MTIWGIIMLDLGTYTSIQVPLYLSKPFRYLALLVSKIFPSK